MKFGYSRRAPRPGREENQSTTSTHRPNTYYYCRAASLRHQETKMSSIVVCRRLVSRIKPERRVQLLQRRPESSTPKATQSTQPTQPTPKAPSPSPIKYAKTSAGSGDPEGLAAAGGGNTGFSMRGPVTWPALGLVAVAAASAVAYYKIERERRLENAMGKIVSSELGWSPNPELLARRQYVRTKWGWFPKEDAFGGGEYPRYSLSLGVPLVLLCGHLCGLFFS